MDRRAFLRQASRTGAGVAGLSVLGTGAKAGAAEDRPPGPAANGPAYLAQASAGLPRLSPGSMIQTSFRSASVRNLEAVILEGKNLVHWFRLSGDPGQPWLRGQTVSRAATGPGSLIQSSFRSGAHGNFEVVVQERNELVHYFHDNADVRSPWRRAQVISRSATGPGGLIQSSFRTGEHGNFEVVVLEGKDLVHYFHDNADVSSPWRRGQVITRRATGPGSIIQGSFKSGGHGIFEVVVQEGNDLVHYSHDHSDANRPWQRGPVISSSVTGPGCIIQSSFRSGDHGNFEVVVLEGDLLIHYFHDNADVRSPWRRAQVISTAATGPGCLLQSDLQSGVHGNFEVLAQERFGAVVHYWHNNQDVSFWWQRGPVLVANEPEPERYGARKRVQVTGRIDRQTRQATPNAAAAIAGTDLGASFVHKRRIYFLFGDTNRRLNTEGPPLESEALDAIAYTTETQASGNLRLTFNNRAPELPGVRQLGFEVPAEGISAGDCMYVWFITDRREDRPQSRTVLACSRDDGNRFERLYDLSTEKFINISAQVVQNSAVPGLPERTGEGLLLWGSGRYRASDVYLAYQPLSGLGDPRAIRYYSGRSAWSRRESDAVSLFPDGTVGELSVRWNSFLSQWIMLYNSDNPRGIVMRRALTPWAWTEPQLIFHPWRHGGYGVFMHRADGNGSLDRLSEPGREREWGGEYAPYQIAPYATGVTGEHTRIYFLMSTWNPYQVVLMSVVVGADGKTLDPDRYP